MHFFGRHVHIRVIPLVHQPSALSLSPSYPYICPLKPSLLILAPLGPSISILAPTAPFLVSSTQFLTLSVPPLHSSCHPSRSSHPWRHHISSWIFFMCGVCAFLLLGDWLKFWCFLYVGFWVRFWVICGSCCITCAHISRSLHPLFHTLCS